MSSNQTIDKANNVRPGEELDLEKLVPWLCDQIPGLTGLPEVTQYSGGASNWTYCLAYPHDRELILQTVLRPAPKPKVRTRYG